jgi:CRP-like cAMP-binding protein
MLAIDPASAYICGITGSGPFRLQAPVAESGRAPACKAESIMDAQNRNRASAHPNHVIATLTPNDFELLGPHLKPFELVHEDLLFDAGETVNWAYFPHSGVISLVVGLGDGQLIEAAMVGRDSLVGGSAAMDGKVSLNRGIVQVAGMASILDVDVLRDVAEKSPAFRTTLIRHEQALFAQAQQSAACNASHSVESRLARWLLRTRDLTGGDKLELTQEFLAQMLGVRRTSVSLVANTLQSAGFIRYSRGHVQILNLDGLRETSCECYETVKAHNDRLIGNGPK